MPSPGPTDLKRWYLMEVDGLSVDQIAAKQGRKPFEVQASIDYIKEWEFRNSMRMLNAKTVSVAMNNLDGVDRVFGQGLKADKVIFVNKETGAVKKAPDIATRLKTVESIRSFIETVQPKAPGLQLNQQFVGGQVAGGYGSAVSFESILRKKREARGLINSQDAEIIHAEMTHEEQIADEFKDFGGSGDDEDDDEDEDEDD